MQLELEELGDRLDEAGGATQAQMELNKKREAELASLRRDLEDAAINSENAMAALRKKHNDAVAELSDQLDTVQKMRGKLEKEKSALQREVDELQQSLDVDAKQRQAFLLRIITWAIFNFRTVSVWRNNSNRS